MTLDRIFDLLETEREKSDESRQQMHADLAEIRNQLAELRTEVAVLKANETNQQDGWKTVGWVLTFFVSLAALGVSAIALAQ